MKKIVCVFALIMSLFMVGCSENDRNNESGLNAHSSSAEETRMDYSRYEGMWSCDSNDGPGEGLELEIQVISDMMEITLTNTSDPPMCRVAMVTQTFSFSDIKNSCVEFSYDEDGWGNSATVVLTFRDDNIYCEIKDAKRNEEAMWEIGEGLYNLVRSWSLTE